ncbi:2940_t:CDS:1, partial [Acaulospora colombiana]
KGMKSQMRLVINDGQSFYKVSVDAVDMCLQICKRALTTQQHS